MTAATASTTAKAPGAWRAQIMPSRDDLVDGAFLLVLGVLALVGLRSTYSGSQFLLVGIAGLVLGILVAHLANALRQPVVVVVVLAVAVFFLLGAALAVRADAVGGFLPSAESTRSLASTSVHGWKQLLTTLPPVESSGRLLVIPYILGLVCGVSGFAMARRLRSVVLPLLAPVGVLVMVILLGTNEPAAELLGGGVFAIVALCWVSIRGARVRPPLQNAVGQRSRAFTAAALIGVTAVAAAVVGPSLPSGGDERVVLRDHVVPPFDINAYPSPLVGFRKYTKPTDNLYDQDLFTVQGLPKGSYIRIATLDAYDGAVWGATSGTTPTGPNEPLNAFQRVGSTIATDAEGTPVTLRITIGPAYAAAADVNVWMPTAGSVTSVEFLGDHADDHAAVFVYNRATEHGIVPDRLESGDVYVVDTVIGADDRAEAKPPSKDALPYGSPTLSSDAYSFTSAQATEWSADASGAMGKVLAVADHLAENGAFSDGGGDEAQYLPGHGLFRLSDNFLNDKQQPVGNDEQYAAAFALLANQLGVPARVVLGAEPGARGVVQGKDVHTWVEVHLSDGTWAPIPRSVFMPPVDKHPEKRLPETIRNASSAIVPPPNPVRPRSALDQLADDSDASNHLANATAGGGWQIPGFVVAAVKVTLPPALVIAAVCGVIIGLKVRRRNRRRTLGAAATRVSGGWDEITDYARDLGGSVPARSTRREQATALDGYPVGDLAVVADATVFGPEEPSDEAAEAYWASVEETRRSMSEDLTRWQRWRAELSLRSLRRPRQPRDTATA